jgi:hypothetical protein
MGATTKENPFTWARRKGIKTIVLGVYQPKADGHTEDAVSLDELEAFSVELREKAARVEAAKADRGVMPDEKWERIYLNPTPNAEECAFCRAMPTCPSANRTLGAFMLDGFGAVEEGKAPAPRELDSVGLPLLNRLMHQAPFVEDMILAVRAEVERRLLAGEELADFGLDTGRLGARKFKDAEEAEQLLNKQMRLSKDMIYNFKLKTPTQLEELTKPGEGGEAPVLGDTRWKRVCALVTRNDPKPTVKLKSKIKKPYALPTPTAEGFEAHATPHRADELF